MENNSPDRGTTTNDQNFEHKPSTTSSDDLITLNTPINSPQPPTDIPQTPTNTPQPPTFSLGISQDSETSGNTTDVDDTNMCDNDLLSELDLVLKQYELVTQRMNDLTNENLLLKERIDKVVNIFKKSTRKV